MLVDIIARRDVHNFVRQTQQLLQREGIFATAPRFSSTENHENERKGHMAWMWDAAARDTGGSGLRAMATVNKVSY